MGDVNIDPAWSKAGRESAERHGIPFADAIAAFDDPHRVSIETPIGMYLFAAPSGRVLCVQTVTLRGTTIHEITGVRYATATEATFWEEQQP